MVSEGVDIPRLAVGAWATSYRTPLFFAQAVGRFVRARRPNESATLFLPAVRPLLALAAEMEQERNHVIAPPKVAEDGLLDVVDLPGADSPDELGEFEALEAEAEFAHVLYSGAAHTGDAAAAESLTEDDEDFLGLPGLLSPQMMATLLKQREVEVRAKILDVARRRRRADPARPVPTRRVRHRTDPCTSRSRRCARRSTAWCHDARRSPASRTARSTPSCARSYPDPRRPLPRSTSSRSDATTCSPSSDRLAVGQRAVRWAGGPVGGRAKGTVGAP